MTEPKRMSPSELYEQSQIAIKMAEDLAKLSPSRMQPVDELLLLKLAAIVRELVVLDAERFGTSGSIAPSPAVPAPAPSAMQLVEPWRPMAMDPRSMDRDYEAGVKRLPSLRVDGERITEDLFAQIDRCDVNFKGESAYADPAALANHLPGRLSDLPSSAMGVRVNLDVQDGEACVVERWVIGVIDGSLVRFGVSRDMPADFVAACERLPLVFLR